MRKFLITAAVTLSMASVQSGAFAQYGPPSNGNSAAVLMTPGTVELVAGLNGASNSNPSSWGNGGLATAATFSFPEGVGYDSNGNLYIADSTDYEVRVINSSTGKITLFAGTGTFGNTAPGPTAQATTVGVGALTGLAVDSSDNVYFGDRNNHVVWKVNTSGVIGIFAGTIGSSGYSGDNGPATSATLDSPEELAFDASGNLFVADVADRVVRKINTHGTITTVAGNGTDAGSFTIPTLTGLGGSATSVSLGVPYGVAVDGSGNIYVSDYYNAQVYKVGTNGDMTEFAGTGANPGASFGLEAGDGGPATSATLWRPYGLYVDPIGDVYVVDEFGSSIREVNTSGIIMKVYGDSGDITKGVLGTPDTVTETYNVGDADGIYFITMDPNGNLVVPNADGETIFSAGSTGSYYFGQNNPVDETATSTSLNAISPGYPPYLTVSNPSGVTLNFTSAPTVSAQFGIAGGTCTFPGSLAAGDSCTIVPSFTPTTGGYPGPLVTGTIVIRSNANNVTQSITKTTSPLTIQLSGNGYGTATTSATLMPTPLTFTTPAGVTSAYQQATLTNTGQTPIYVLGTDFTNNIDSAFAVSGTTCPNSTTALAANASCTFNITFDPLRPTTYTTGFQVDVQNYGYLTITVDGTGTGTSTFSTSVVAFGGVVVNQTSPAMSATLKNGQTDGQFIQSIAIVGTNPSDFAITSGANQCVVGGTVDGGGITPGDTCNVYLTFTPASVTSFAATLQLVLKDGATSALTAVTTSLTGNGLPASAAATPIIAPAAGTYNAPVAVQITDSTPSSTIYDTTDGTTPVTTGTPYSAVFTVAKTGTQVQAIAAAPSSSNSAVSSSTYTVQPYLAFSATAVGIASASAPHLTATFSIMGSTAPTASLHYGHDYTLGSVNCTPGGSIEVCTVSVNFIPTLPGARKDALFLMNGTTRVATVLLSGAGQAPFALVQPGNAPATGLATKNEVDMVVDDNDTVYAMDPNNLALYSVTKTGNYTKLPITSPGGLNAVASAKTLDIDGGGVLYFHGQTNDNTIYTYDTVQGIEGEFTLPATGSFETVAVGNTGNVYAVNLSNGVLYTVIPDGDSTTTTLNTAYNNPQYMTVDSGENIYLANTGSIGELPLVGAQSEINTVGAPGGIGSDAAGTLYTAGYPAFPGIAELPASNYSTPLTTVDGGDNFTSGVAVAADGTLMYGRAGSGAAIEALSRSQGAIDFYQQAQGTTSAPQNAGIYNGGNESLTISKIAVSGAGFAMQAAATNNCANGIVLAPGSFCQVETTFNPTAGGSFTGTVTFTSNSLNGASTQTSVSLSGYSNGINVTGTPNPLAFGSQNLGTQATQYITLTNSGYGENANFSGSPSVGAGFTASLGTCGSYLAVGASCQIGVTFDPTIAQPYSSAVALTMVGSTYGDHQAISLTVTGTGIGSTIGTQAIVFAQPVSPVAYAPGLKIPLVATGGASGNPVVFTIDGSSTATGSISGAALTVVGVGTLVIDANQAGNSSYTAAPQVQRTVVVNQAAQSITFTQPTSPVFYSAGLTVPLVATGGASGNPVVFTIDAGSTATGSISGNTLTVKSTGSLIIDANQAGTVNYAPAQQVQRTIVVNTLIQQAIVFTQPASPVTYAPGLTIPLVATGGASGNPVVFTIDGSSTATGSISGATLTITGVGALLIDANQAGNAIYSAAPQVQRTLVVNQAPQAVNFTQPTSPVTYSPSLTILLAATGGASGNPVVFTVDASSTAHGSITGSTLTVTSVGSLVIDANQAGNSTYSAATQVQRTVVVNQAPQTIAFTQPTSPVTYSSGLTITLAASGGASGNPVVFTLDPASTASGSITGSTLTVTSAGKLVIDANQAGNANYIAAAQVQQTVIVSATAPDFAISGSPGSQSILPGAAATFTIIVQASNGSFGNAVTLSATGLPPGATAVFSPTSVTPGSGSQTSTLTVQTLALAANRTAGEGINWPIATPALALLLLVPLRRWRKAWAGKLLLLFACLASLGAALALSGCGGGFGINQPATYSLTVAGTAGTDTHSTTVQLTVQ